MSNEFNSPGRHWAVYPDARLQYPFSAYTRPTGASREPGRTRLARNFSRFGQQSPVLAPCSNPNSTYSQEFRPVSSSIMKSHTQSTSLVTSSPLGNTSYDPQYSSSRLHGDLSTGSLQGIQPLSASTTHLPNQSFSSVTPLTLRPRNQTVSAHDVSSQQRHSIFFSNPTAYSRNDFTIPSAQLGEPATFDKTFFAEIDRDLNTRNICVAALIVGWGVSFASLTVGIYLIVAGPVQAPQFLLNRLVAIGNLDFQWLTVPNGMNNPYIDGHRVYPVPEAVMIILSLVLTFGLTTIFDSMNYIHTTSLRWALWRENKSFLNSNMRLFTYAKDHLPNQWPANIISGLALIVAYGGIGILTFNVYIVASLVKKGKYIVDGGSISGPRNGIDFNAWGLLGVGVGTLLQAIISTTCLLYKGGLIKTWSSNPLASAKACRSPYGATTWPSASTEIEPTRSEMSSSNSNIHLFSRHGESQVSVSQSAGTMRLYSSSTDPQYSFSRPSKEQEPLRVAIPATRRIANCVWILFAIVCLLCIIVTLLAKKANALSSTWVKESSERLDFLAYVQNFGQVVIHYTYEPYLNPREWLALIIQSLATSLILGSIHFVEILTLLVRDERIWRKATTDDGAHPNSSTLLQAASNWQCWVLFAFKSIIPWIFSSGFSCNTMVVFNLIPLAAVAALFLMLAIFAEALIRWEPKGHQPATYGSMPALLTLVDEWNHKKLYWGQKGEVLDGFGNAGTAGSRLADVEDTVFYPNLKVRIVY